MLLDIFKYGFSVEVIISLLATVFVVFCTLPIHEYAHALVATKLGDDTPRLKGRLTLAPLAHIDPMGALMIFLVGFGYAKPVPVNPRKFKNPKAGMALTAFAGPAANLIMAFVFMLLRNFCGMLGRVAFNFDTPLFLQVTQIFLMSAATVNVSLAVFNLIPIPPLDGSRILNLIIPSKYYFKIMRYERYIILGVFALLFLGVLNVPLAFLTSKIMYLISWITSVPFNLF